MSKKNTMEKYMVGSSLFRNQKNQPHTLYMTQQQYFSTFKGQSGTKSHFKYMSDVRYSPKKAWQQSQSRAQKKVIKLEQLNNNLQKEGRVQDDDNPKVMKQKQQKFSYTNSVLIKTNEYRPQQQDLIASFKVDPNQRMSATEGLLGQSVLEYQEQHLAKSESQEIRVSESKRKDRSRYQNYDYSNINIVISPSPQPKPYIDQPQINNQFTQTSHQSFDLQVTPESRKSSIYKKNQDKQQNNSINRSQLSGLNYSKVSNTPQKISPSSSKVRTFKYSLMQSPNKNIGYQKAQRVQRTPIEGIALQHKNYKNQIGQRQKWGSKWDYRQQINKRFNFFMATHREASTYVESIQFQLKEAYFSLQTIQSDIDRIIHNNLQLQCQKIRNSLLKIIDNGISRFKDSQQRLLELNKIIFIGELYEIKSNMELRQQQIQKFKSSFDQKLEWRQTVNQLLVPDFEQNVRFLLDKSDEIGNEWLGCTNQFLSKYNNQVFQSAHTTLQKEVTQALGQTIERFSFRHLYKMQNKKDFGTITTKSEKKMKQS